MTSLTGESKTAGVAAVSGAGLGPGVPGIFGESQDAEGVRGVGHEKAGVSGESRLGTGVRGESQNAEGVRGVGHGGAGVFGTSGSAAGVHGESERAGGVRGVGRTGAGVFGESASGIGVHGESRGAEGVRGVGHAGGGVAGFSRSGVGVFGAAQQNDGVHGETLSPTHAGVAGINLNPLGTGAGVYGESRGAGAAGYFNGNVVVTGDICLPDADLAENFALREGALAEPGSVMVIDDEERVTVSASAYDRRVAGVVSGAGAYKPAIILHANGASVDRVPLAMVGKVYCKVDAEYGAIDVGDLLVTSPTQGHAMRAADPTRSFGAVIGKALRPLGRGRGLIPILVALQ